MRSLAVVQASTPLPGATSVEFRGHLSLRQRDPLYSGPTRTLYDTTPFKLTADSESLTENSPANLNHILRKYTDRNETTHLEYDVPPVFGFEPSETFDVKLTVRIPNQIISYRPGTAYVLYQAWVQYISFLIPTWYHLSFFLLSFFLSLFLLSFFFLSLSFFFLSFANLMLKMCELCEISPSN